MSGRLAVVQELLVECVGARDPVAALEAALARDDARLDARARAWLEGIDRDGLRISGLLVAKLRCERIGRGDLGLRERMEREPARFAEQFARYRAAVTAKVFPEEEASSFVAFTRDSMP